MKLARDQLPPEYVNARRRFREARLKATSSRTQDLREHAGAAYSLLFGGPPPGPCAQELARLQRQIQVEEDALFPDGNVPRDEDLFAELQTSGRAIWSPVRAWIGSWAPRLWGTRFAPNRGVGQEEAVWHRSPPAQALGAQGVVDVLSTKMARRDNGHVPYRPVPMRVRIGSECTEVQHEDERSYVTVGGKRLRVWSGTPSAWILRDPSRGQYSILNWTVPLSEGELTPVEPGLNPLPHRQHEPAFCGVDTDGDVVLAFANGFAMKGRTTVGLVDVGRTDVLSWCFRCEIEAPIRPPYRIPPQSYRPEKKPDPRYEAWLHDETNPPWAVEFVPVPQREGQPAWAIRGDGDAPPAHVILNDQIFARVTGENLYRSADGCVLVAEHEPALRLRRPVEGEVLGSAGEWVERGRLCRRASVQVEGLDGPASLVSQGERPVRLEHHGAPLQDGVFRFGSWILHALKGQQTFWRIGHAYDEGYLCRRLGSDPCDPDVMVLVPEGLAEASMPGLPCPEGGLKNVVVKDRRLYRVKDQRDDLVVLQPLRWPDCLQEHGSSQLYRWDGTQLQKQDSGIFASTAWLAGRTYQIDGNDVSGPFRIYRSYDESEQRIVRRSHGTLHEVEGPVDGLCVLHDEALHDVALPLETLDEAFERFSRLITDNALLGVSLSGAEQAVRKYIRQSMRAGETNHKPWLDAFRRGDDTPVGDVNGLTGRDLRRALGFDVDRPFELLVRREATDPHRRQRPVTGTDGLRRFPGDARDFVFRDRNGNEAQEAALDAYFEECVPTLETLKRIVVPPVRTVFSRALRGGEAHFDFTWDGGHHRVPLTAEADLTADQINFFGQRFSQLSPKLIRALRRVDVQPIDGAGRASYEGVLDYHPWFIEPHRQTALDHEMLHMQTNGDRTTDFLTAIALKLGLAPDDDYADVAIEEAISVHWERLCANPGGVLGKNERMDRLAIACAVDPAFGTALLRDKVDGLAERLENRRDEDDEWGLIVVAR